MNEINTAFLNQVKNRFLPLPRSAVEELEHEPNITDFNIIKEIGNGSFGKVYLAIHKKTKVKYAIKAIDKLNIENKMEKTSFNREVEIMYKLDHPNIVKLYSHFEDSKYCYLIMQYIPNGNAYDLLIKNGKKPDMQLVASIVRDVVRAVYYLHNMVPIIMHRDIKPENILLDENYNAHLIDFGWSNYIINGRRRNSICGTPLYYPPEMINDLGHDETADIWCIGILLVELSCGKTPFKGNDMETVGQNISELNISWPNNIDPDIKDLCSKILTANSSQRPDLEYIYEHKFFKKHIKGLDIDKKLIKPKKPKNKIFIVNKDIPNENKEEINKAMNDNNDKKYYTSERRSKTSKNLDIYQIENKTDPKEYKTKIIKNENNYKEINKINIKKNLYKTTIKSDKNLNFRINNDLKKMNDSIKINHNHSYYHSKDSKENHSRKPNLNHEYKIINDNRANHCKIYSSSFINNRKEENKVNNNNYIKYDKYNDTRSKNSFLSSKNVSSFYKIKNTIPINPNKYKNYENLNKQTKDKIYNNLSRGKNEHLNTYSNLRNKSKDMNFKYNTIINENNGFKNRFKNSYTKINTTYANNMIINKEYQFKEKLNDRRKNEKQKFNTINNNYNEIFY